MSITIDFSQVYPILPIQYLFIITVCFKLPFIVNCANSIHNWHSNCNQCSISNSRALEAALPEAIQLLGNGSLISASKHILGIIFEPHMHARIINMSQTLEAPQTRSPRANFIYAEAETRTRIRSDNATTPRNNPKGSRTCTSTCHGLHSQL